jgi:hypothetical protein
MREGQNRSADRSSLSWKTILSWVTIAPLRWIWKKSGTKMRIGEVVFVVLLIVGVANGHSGGKTAVPGGSSASASSSKPPAKSRAEPIPRGKWLTNDEATQIYQLGSEGLDQMGDPVKLGNKSVRCEGVGTERPGGRHQYFMCGDYDSIESNALTYYTAAQLRKT